MICCVLCVAKATWIWRSIALRNISKLSLPFVVPTKIFLCCSISSVFTFAYWMQHFPKRLHNPNEMNFISILLDLPVKFTLFICHNNFESCVPDLSSQNLAVGQVKIPIHPIPESPRTSIPIKLTLNCGKINSFGMME